MSSRTQFLQRGSQFSVAELFEFVTVCSVLAALSPILGLVTSASLAVLAGALTLRCGLWALVAFGVALVNAGVADANPLGKELSESAKFLAAVLVLGLTFLFCVRAQSRPKQPCRRTDDHDEAVQRGNPDCSQSGLQETRFQSKDSLITHGERSPCG